MIRKDWHVLGVLKIWKMCQSLACEFLTNKYKLISVFTLTSALIELISIINDHIEIFMIFTSQVFENND